MAHSIDDAAAEPPVMTIRAFLDQVSAVLHRGLPRQVWLEATVLTAKVGPHGHTLELADPKPCTGNPPHLRVFLPNAAREAIGRCFGFPVDPVLLVGMTTILLVQPAFSATWHLGGRVTDLSRSVETSLRRERLKQAVSALKREGLFGRQHTLPTPRDITRIAVIHPAGSAGWADVAVELARWQQSGLIVVRSIDAPFEGERAVMALVAAVQEAVAPIDGHGPDLLLILRGGGSRAGLLAFDHEALARAICRCPVPIVAGVGHATDTSLVDLVAYKRVDTPSKAYAVVAAIMTHVARQAISDHQAIMGHAARRIALGAQDIQVSRQQIESGLDRLLAAAQSRLGAGWSATLLAATTIRDRTGKLAAAAALDLHAVLSGAPAALDHHGTTLRRLLTNGLERSGRVLGRHDGGSRLLAACGSRALALIQRQGAEVDRLHDTCMLHATRQRDVANTDLTHARLVIDAHDPAAILRRGFVMVIDGAGRVLPTRAVAAAADRLQLRFSDGDLAVAADTEVRR